MKTGLLLTGNYYKFKFVKSALYYGTLGYSMEHVVSAELFEGSKLPQPVVPVMTTVVNP